MGKPSITCDPLGPFEDGADIPTEELDFHSLKFINDLVEYSTFDAHDFGLHYETRTLTYLRGLLSSPRVSLIVLTGDAGQGKAHLCRHLLPGANRPVRVIENLREFEPEGAAQLLIDLLDDTSTIGIVCTTEDHLRVVTNRRPQRLTAILDTLLRGLIHGTTADATGRIHVVNLNFQGAAPLDDQRGFLRYLLDAWTSDDRTWRACATCKAKLDCPISLNRERLAGLGTGSSSDSWRSGLIQLIRTVEQTSYVLTFRGTLMLMAYLLTGGLRCREVHDLIQREQHQALANYRLERLLFERPLDEVVGEQLRVLTRIRRYDPGLVALRDVDDEIIDTLEFEDALGDAVWLGAAQVPQTHEQLLNEALSFAALVRSKRREVYFQIAASGPLGVFDRARRLGFYRYGWFDYIQRVDDDPAQMNASVAHVIAGLHVLQGIRPPDTSHLYIIDPTFSRVGSGTAVIAGRVHRSKLSLRGHQQHWQDKQQGLMPALTEAVDWLGRAIVLTDEQNHVLVELDVMQFEFVMRAADGAGFVAFHAAERRRVLSRLGQYVEHLPREHDIIHIVVAGRICGVVFERDDSIEVLERGE